MKFFKITTLLFLISFTSFSQKVTDTIKVSLDMNAYIIFDKGSDIKFNFASPDMKADLFGNKLTVQGLEVDFITTNMLVEVDNNLYMFIVEYDANPDKFIFNYTSNQSNAQTTKANDTKNSVSTNANKIGYADNRAILVDSSGIKQAIEDKKIKDSINKTYKNYTDRILMLDQKIKSVGYDKYKLKVAVTNINVVDDKMVIKVVYLNNSGIDYDIDYLDIYVKEKQRRTKKNTTQEVKCKILFANQELKVLKANDRIEMAYVIDKITISKKKDLVLSMLEENKQRRGDRNILIKIPYQYITKAKQLL